MSVIHRHDDNQFVILDQVLYISHIYTHAKNWRKSTTTESSNNLTWKKDLFHVERPFRMTNTEQTNKKKKKNTV